MKKSAIYILLVITLIFAAFTFGLYAGRNFHDCDMQISGGPLPSQTSSGHSPSGSGSQPASVSDSSTAKFPININTASAAELDLLPGIGPVLAQRILDYRTEYGSFASVKDLMYVEGIGEKTLSKILDYITV